MARSSELTYRLVPATPGDKAWLEQLRRSVYRDLFFATWGGWDEARHQRHCAECWDAGQIFLIETDGDRVGMIQIHVRPEVIEIGEMQIGPRIRAAVSDRKSCKSS